MMLNIKDAFVCRGSGGFNGNLQLLGTPNFHTHPIYDLNIIGAPRKARNQGTHPQPEFPES